MNSKTLFTFFGHHKCATTWINNIVWNLCKELNLKLDIVYVPKMFNKDLKIFIKEERTGFLFYGNANINYVNELENFKGFHLIRDPRDVVVSGYFSHLKTHKITSNFPIEAHRENLQKTSKDEGLLLEMDFSEEFFQDMSTWNYSQPNVLEIKFEDLIQNPYPALVDAFSFLGLVDDRYYNLKKQLRVVGFELSKRYLKTKWGLERFRPRRNRIYTQELLGIIYRHRFSAKANGRKEGNENVNSHYRKGVAGDWVNHFNADHKKYFKEKYNDLLIKLGYEKDANW